MFNIFLMPYNLSFLNIQKSLNTGINVEDFFLN